SISPAAKQRGSYLSGPSTGLAVNCLQPSLLDGHRQCDYISSVHLMEYMDLAALGALARTLRQQADLSQKQVADLVNTTQSNVSAAENEEGRYVSVAIRITEALGDKRVIGPYYRAESIDQEDRDRE